MKKYRLQQYLELKIETHGKARFEEYFDNEYSRVDETCIATQSPASTITLEIVDELPVSVDDKSIVRSENFKKLFQYEFVIVDLESNDIKIYFKNHRIANIYTTAVGVFIQAQVLEPIMYLALLRQGIVLLHSAGVTKEGLSYIFPAYGGTGKTTTCMSLLQKGYNFLGDDLLLIDAVAGRVYPYPRPLHVFTYNITNLPGTSLPFRLLFFVYFKNFLRYFLEKLLRTEFLISTRVHADEIIPGFKLSTFGELHNVIFLKKEGQSESIKFKNDEAIEIHAKNIVESADLNESLYRLLDDAAVKELKKQEIESVVTILKNICYFGYLNTRSIDLKTIDHFLDNVEA